MTYMAYSRYIGYDIILPLSENSVESIFPNISIISSRIPHLTPPNSGSRVL